MPKVLLFKAIFVAFTIHAQFIIRYFLWKKISRFEKTLEKNLGKNREIFAFAQN